MNANNRDISNIFLCVATASFCCFLMLGCSSQDFGRPISSPISDKMDSGKPYVSGNAEKEALVRAHKLAKVLGEWKREVDDGTGRDYHVGKDDILKISVLSLEEPGKTSDILRTVAEGGTINFPWVGNVSVGGLTVKEVEATVKKTLDGKFLKNPEVTVSISLYKSAPVVITGAVTKPGVYYLNRDKKTILELLAECDGLSTEAGDELYVIRGEQAKVNPRSVDENTGIASTNQESMIMINMKQLLDEGDVRLNIWVGGGDIVNVLPRNKDYVYVLGYVQHPGMFEMKEGKPVGALQAVAMAGGLSSSARAQNTYLLRQTADGQHLIPVDLTKIARGIRPRLYMETGDTLVVGSSFLAKLSEFIKPSISAGASYTPMP